jgi:hypothetical protein
VALAGSTVTTTDILVFLPRPHPQQLLSPALLVGE